jgi:hypothetical protein
LIGCAARGRDEQSRFDAPLELRGTHRVPPELVAEVTSRVRRAMASRDRWRSKGLREDGPASDVRLDPMSEWPFPAEHLPDGNWDGFAPKLRKR